MLWSRHIPFSIFLLLIILISGFCVLNSKTLQIMNSKAQEDKNVNIAIFFGSDRDKKLGEELIKDLDGKISFYNISSVLTNESFGLDNTSITAVWWLNELLLPIDFSIFGDIAQWIKEGRGIFILNQFFQKTPLQELRQIGIESYSPFIYPLNQDETQLDLKLNKDAQSMLNISLEEIEFNGSCGWVQLNNQTTILAEIPLPIEIPLNNHLTSGIWLHGSKIVVGSFSLRFDQAINSMYSLLGIHNVMEYTIIDIIRQSALLSISDIPTGAHLQLTGFEYIFNVAILSIGIIFAIFLSIKLGILSKLNELIFGLFTGFIFFIAHVTYSPQRRRISEEELLDNELRGSIVDYLELKGGQGAHLREIQRELGCGISTLLWHLQALDDFNFVTHEKIGKYHIFYITGEKSIQTSEIALALKSDVAKDLCRLLIRKKKPVSLSKISREISVHHSSVQHHIKKLLDLEVILLIKEKKRSYYGVNPKQIRWLKDHLEIA
ncbi:hypothetical protein [Candidatus Hodarchaeum mangrovi]